MLPEPRNDEENYFMTKLYSGTVMLGMTEWESQWKWWSDGAHVTWFIWTSKTLRHREKRAAKGQDARSLPE